MSLPDLPNWLHTGQALHRACEIIAPVHHLLLETQPNFLHLPLHVGPHGIASRRLPGGSLIRVDFRQGAMLIDSGGQSTGLPLADHSQRSLLEAMLRALQETELPGLADEAEAGAEGALTAAMKRRLTASGKPEFSRATALDDETPLAHDPFVAADYADVLYAAFTGIARFRARLSGHMSPMVVWPEHFDLSTLWFRAPEMDERGPHLNFGFAPFSPGFDRPYLYAYAYPYPPGVALPAVPEPAFWHTASWKGVAVSYDDFPRNQDLALFVEGMCTQLFEALRPLLSG